MDSVEPKGGSSRLHRLNAKSDVLVEVDAQGFRAINDVVAAYGSGEAFIFELLPGGFHVDFGDAPARLDVADGGKKPSQFVAGE